MSTNLTLNSVSPSRALLLYRLQWYRHQMQQNLIRYKHSLLFLLLLIVPSISGIIWLFSSPILTIITATTLSNQIVISLFLIEMIYVIWVSIQRVAILPQSIDKYLHTLPIANKTYLLADTILLIIANNILLLPLLLALFVSGYIGDINIQVFLSFLVLSLSIFMLQYNTLKRNFVNVIIVFGVNIAFLLSLNITSTYHQIFFKITQLILLVTLIMPITPPGVLLKLNALLNRKRKGIRYRLFKKTPIFWVMLDTYLTAYKTLTMVRLMASLSVIAISLLILILGEHPEHLSIITYSSFGLCTLIISGLSTKSATEKEAIQLYLNTLPFKHHSWIIREINALMTLCLLPIIFFILVLILNKINFNLWHIVLLQYVLMSVLYFIQTQFRLFGTILAILCYGLYITIVIVS